MATYIRYRRNLRQYVSSNLAFSQPSDKAHFFYRLFLIVKPLAYGEYSRTSLYKRGTSDRLIIVKK